MIGNDRAKARAGREDQVRSRWWLRVAVVVGVVAAAVWAVGTFGLPGWLLADQHPVRNVLEGLSWPAAIVATVALGTPTVGRWMRGRPATPPAVSRSAERPVNPLMGRALHLLNGELPPVSAVGLLDLRVKPAIDTHAEDGSDLPPYVPRDIDTDLEWAIHTGGMVLLHGPAAVGKSRAAAEALRRLRPGHKLLVPDGGPALRELVDAGVDMSETVLWLDDLERYVGADGLDVGLLQRLCPGGSTELTVVATMRDEQLALYVDADSRLTTEAGTRIDQAAVEVLARVRGRRRIRVAAVLTDTERTRACRTGERDARVKRALAAQEGFAEYLAAGAAMMDRWCTGESPEFIRGQALISAAIDCRRAGHHDPVPAGLLADLHTQFLPPIWRQRADLPSVDLGLHWATRLVLGASSCLQPLSGQRYLASDYLLDRAQQAHPDSVTPLTGPVSNTTWTTLTTALTPKQALHIGVSAYRAGRRDIAEQAFISASAYDSRALVYRGIVLSEQPGREGDAERVYRRAIAAGEPDALFNLGNLLREQPGRETEAEQLYRNAATAGVAEAQHNLGNLLSKQPGRETEAEQHYRNAATAGVAEARFGLANLLREQPGREADAEQTYIDAALTGDTRAVLNLGFLLSRQPGREADAEQHYRDAVTAGVPDAQFFLGVLLSEQPGREADAERAYRDAATAGDSAALLNLGNLLSELPGREADAELAYRDAATAGDFKALHNLGNLLSEQPGREADAEQAYRDAATAGVADAQLGLGNLLSDQPGREADAEQAYRDAVTAGVADAQRNLQLLLNEQARRRIE